MKTNPIMHLVQLSLRYFSYHAMATALLTLNNYFLSGKKNISMYLILSLYLYEHQQLQHYVFWMLMC